MLTPFPLFYTGRAFHFITCSLTSATLLFNNSINWITAPASITIWVCWDVPDAMLVRAQAASNYKQLVRSKGNETCLWTTLACKRVWSERRNWTKRGTTPQAMTCSMGGFFSRESSFLNWVVAASCVSTFCECTFCTSSGKISMSFSWAAK